MVARVVDGWSVAAAELTTMTTTVSSSTLRDRVLRHFPARTHPLTLVRDPEGMLTDDVTLAALVGRGFGVVSEDDPVALRHRIEVARPFTPGRPLLVITTEALNQLPYDLWSTGHQVEISLHTFFPTLNYPTVQGLSAAARERLGRVAPPLTTLGPRETRRHLLRAAFDADPTELGEPAALVAWLADYHGQGDPLPAAMATDLIAALRAHPAYAGWPLETLLEDRDAFSCFLREQWRGYVGAQIGRALNETPVPYLLSFDRDTALQDTLPRLLRSGVLEPVDVAEPGRLPGWTRPAVVLPDEDRRQRRFNELVARLEESLASPRDDARWAVWQEVAGAWAELTTIRDAADLDLEPEQEAAWCRLAALLDQTFVEWLRPRYSVLAGQRVPRPHHVHHLPDFLAYQRRQGQADRVALLVLDGLALRDWSIVGAAWRGRHPAWRFDERLVLAQIPTITAISRQALVSGLRPADFATTIGHNRAEPALWRAFWARQDAPLPADACVYARLGVGHDDPTLLLGSRVRAVCLIDTSVDVIVHGVSLGGAEVQTSLGLWLDQVSSRVEAAISGLLERGFTVYLSSDHGHVESRGVGQPSEGVVVETRGRRARTYRDHRAAAHVREAFPDTELWDRDGLLPDDLWAVMPLGRDAFAPEGDTVVTHGGLTLDEVVVPFVTIRLR